MMALGTVIPWFRVPALMTTYAVITLAMDPIGCCVAEDRDHRSVPVAPLAISAYGARTPAAGPPHPSPRRYLAVSHRIVSAARARRRGFARNCTVTGQIF